MTTLIEGLPEDISLRCLARVPYYLFPKLETVSHSWRAAVRSTEFYKARQAVNSTESLLCVCGLDQIDRKNICQLYDPNRDIWLALPVLPSKVRNLTKFRVASVSGKLFVLAGRNSDQDRTTSKNEVWAYDPIFRQWAQKASMIVPRASFACCVWNGKILVAGGFTTLLESTSEAEIYDPDSDTWKPIPDLYHGYNSPCIGFVMDGAVHVVNRNSKEVQVLENLTDKWRRSHSLNQGRITVVNGSLYGTNSVAADIYKLERGIWKVVASAWELRYRLGYAMMGFHNDIYVIGGVIRSDRWSVDFKKMSGVDVLVLRNKTEKPMWKKVAAMTLCEGFIHGCAELRI